ncbi:MAG: hypothetical protein OXF27_10565 [Acidobacteria bacterium]|nr:hypothetical protein [Acidobacteriota bacterium]
MRTPIGGLRLVAASVLALVLLLPAGAAAQADPFNFRFTSGQSVAPFFDGWSRNPDGTFEMHFGYINRNHVEEVHVPIGADNLLESGPEDQGQPTFFYPRVHRQVFSVTVPADFGDRELIWSLTMRGQRQQAIAWLDAVWEIDPVLRGREPTDAQRANQAPSLSITAAATTLNLPDTLAVTATMTDDELPGPRTPRLRARGQETPPALQPPQDEPRAPVNVPVLRRGTTPSEVKIDEQLSLTWTVLRGPASVEVEADSPEPGTDGPASMTATFTRPGDYLLRARLSDGHLYDEQELAVTVR